MYKKTEKYMAYIMLVIMCISLLPVMYVGRYNHPTGDDYYYGVEARQAVESGANIFEVFGEAAKGVAREYMRWQGTYSAMFLMHLPPNVFSEEAYAFVTAILILLFAGGVFFLLKPIVCDFLKGSKSFFALTASVYVMLCLQTTPFLGESLFWYNGSMYYTGFLTFTMFFWGGVVRFLIKPRKYHIPLLAVLAFFLAGGNYVSLLPCMILLVVLTAWLCFNRSKRWGSVAILTVVMLIGMLISMLAPGNAIRQADLYQISAVKAILKSLLQGVKFILGWTNVWLVLAAVLLTPFMWNSFAKKSFRFRYPILVLGFAYGVFCSMACPTFYSMNSTGPARVVAIIYYAFMAFMLFCYYYVLGYVYDLLERKGKITKTDAGKTVDKRIALATIGVFVLLFAVQLFTGKAAECTTIRAFRILESGEAQAYHEENLARQVILRDASVKDVVFSPFEHQPDLLYVGDFTGDATNGNNVRIAGFWGKNSIRVDYE